MSSTEDGSCLSARFERQSSRTPENIAVEYEGARLTYRELDQLSSALAARLRPAIAAPGQLVGLCLGRSLELIIGMLGILKAGGAYVPIDPDYPADRIRLLFEDSGVSAVVTRRANLTSLPQGERAVFLVDAAAGAEPQVPRPAGSAGSDSAYVIYTSGSTGTPKGTVVEHHNVLRLFDATRPWFEPGPRDVWTLFHSVSFDFSVWEIWGALLHGGKLVIVPSEVAATPGAFAALLDRSDVTVLNQTPSAFTQLARVSAAANRRYPLLRLVIFGGERLEAAHLQTWIERYGDQSPRLVNMYGITETTVHVTYRPMTAADLKRPDRSPIGVPIPDLWIHLRGADGTEVADGEAGEIIVSGPGVSRGYLGRPELTAERFPMLPLGPGGALVRCYRSGDLAARQDGDLVYLGRIDDQVKVRGYRIEPREIEIQLAGCPEVETCVVIARDFGEGDTRLLAFVKPRPGFSGIAPRVLDAAARLLPGYMRPSRVIEVDEIPLTAHGKRDRAELLRRLEASSLAEAGTGNADAAGSTSVVAELARALLDPDITLDVDLFDQGATSLSLARLILDVNAAFGLSLTGAELAGDASIVNIGAVVDRFLMERKSEMAVNGASSAGGVQ